MKYSQLKTQVRELEDALRRSRSRSDYFMDHCERLHASFETRVRLTLKEAEAEVASSNKPIMLCENCPNLRLPS